jgi:hypothetical protein
MGIEDREQDPYLVWADRAVLETLLANRLLDAEEAIDGRGQAHVVLARLDGGHPRAFAREVLSLEANARSDIQEGPSLYPPRAEPLEDEIEP